MNEHMSEPILPQPNVNEDAVQWSRSITKLSQGNARDLARVAQDLEMSNRATAGQMGVIGRQLEVIAAQNEFLVNQTGGATKLANIDYTREPAQNFSDVPLPFNPDNDPELVFTTGTSGRFRSEASFNAVAYALSSATSYTRVSVQLVVGVYRNGVKVGQGARLVLSSLAEKGNVSEYSSTITGEFVFSGLPNQEYTLRAERYVSGDVGTPGVSGTKQAVWWSNISISYTNLWN